MLNKVILIGRMVKDVELRYTPNGKGVANFTLAVETGFGDKKNTDYPNCVVWGKTSENVAQYTKKGSLVAVEGRIQTRSYDNSEGKKVFVTEVVADNVRFLDTKQKHSIEEGSTPLDDFDSQLPF